MELCEIVCPTCFESFEVAAPTVGDTAFPVEIDYDCAICCRPMVIVFEVLFEDSEVTAVARGLGE